MKSVSITCSDAQSTCFQCEANDQQLFNPDNIYKDLIDDNCQQKGLALETVNVFRYNGV